VARFNVTEILLSHLHAPVWWKNLRANLQPVTRGGKATSMAITVVLAGVIGIVAGLISVLFASFIQLLESATVLSWVAYSQDHAWAILLLVATPVIGILGSAWIARTFAPETQGPGIPEVMTALGRHEGRIRPRVALCKFLASGLCIGLGGSLGREGPIVQICASLGSTAGQTLGLPRRSMKVLVAAGAAAGISATFHAPLAGVIFASEVILMSFAVETLAPIVVASVLANVIHGQFSPTGRVSAFTQLNYEYFGDWNQLPSLAVLGLLCGIAAVAFTKAIFRIDAFAMKRIPHWWARAVIFGSLLGMTLYLYPSSPNDVSQEATVDVVQGLPPSPPLAGVGYDVIDHALHIENSSKPTAKDGQIQGKVVSLTNDEMLSQLLWLLPLVFLKPLLTSTTLAGGGSGGVFAPCLMLGATLGASFGIVCNLLFPEASANPGLYAIVGMGAVVAGSTHGMLSAILIVYEMTNSYEIILPIMITAGIASAVARLIDRQSIYEKKLTSKGVSIARGHDTQHLEHVLVREVMTRNFPSVKSTDDASEIVRVARANPAIEALPVMDAENQLVGIIRAEDLHRVLDSDVSPRFIFADDLAAPAPLSLTPNQNLIEAIREFGAGDSETLPVEVQQGGKRRLLGLLLWSDVVRRYRSELLQKR